MSQKDIQALVRLLDDSNPKLAEQAGDALVEFGAAALPALQELADHRPTLSGLLTQRIRAQLLEKEWATLARLPDAEAASLLLARWLDPLIDPADITTQLDALADPLHGALPTAKTKEAYRRDALLLREWLAGVKGFNGNMENYYAPKNSLLPHVLQSRRGIPLTLSMIYLFVARRLQAPLYAIGMPSHFIVRYGDAVNGIYLDPFHQGALMTNNDCRRLAKRFGHNWRDEYLKPVSDHTIIERMLRNLINAYIQQQSEPAASQAIKYLKIWIGDDK